MKTSLSYNIGSAIGSRQNSLNCFEVCNSIGPPRRTYSIKSQAQNKRSKKTAQKVLIQKENSCPGDRATFMGNYKNKERFIQKLTENLRQN